MQPTTIATCSGVTARAAFVEVGIDHLISAACELPRLTGFAGDGVQL